MNKISKRIASIEQVTDQYLKQKSKDTAFSEKGNSYEEI